MFLKKIISKFGCSAKDVIRCTAAMPYYAVARGRSAGIFSSWGECEDQVKGYSGARYKKFNSEGEARNFIQENSAGGGTSYTGAKPANVRPISVATRTFTTKSGASKPTTSTASKTKSKDSKKGYEQNGSFNIDDLDDPLEINDAVCKQLDALENRLTCVKNNVDKIYNGYGKTRSKRTLPTEAHHLSKRRRSTDRHDVDDNGYVQVYTDGACSSNGQRGARAGYGVWWGDDHPLNESGRVERPTNNSGEIQAAARACQQARDNGITKLCINTDSKFLIDSATKWMPGWKKNGWQLRSGNPVKNTADFQELERASHGLDVKWRYVEAHRGVHGNECADELARRGAAGDF